MAQRTCRLEGCERICQPTKVVCSMHLSRKYRLGSYVLPARVAKEHIVAPPKLAPPPRLCAVDGCGRLHFSLGWCEPHHGRWRRHGEIVAHIPIGATRRGLLTEEERFWSKVDASGDCWEWTAGRTGFGYGLFSSRTLAAGASGNIQAHRWAWQSLVGPVPAGLVLDHLCRNRICVNPSHLEPVTIAENVRRSWVARPRVAA